MILIQTSYSQNGKENEYKEALINCDNSYEILLNHLSICDKSDSLKSIYIKTLNLKLTLYDTLISNLRLQIINKEKQIIEFSKKIKKPSRIVNIGIGFLGGFILRKEIENLFSKL